MSGLIVGVGDTLGATVGRAVAGLDGVNVARGVGLGGTDVGVQVNTSVGVGTVVGP